MIFASLSEATYCTWYRGHVKATVQNAAGADAVLYRGECCRGTPQPRRGCWQVGRDSKSSYRNTSLPGKTVSPVHPPKGLKSIVADLHSESLKELHPSEIQLTQNCTAFARKKNAANTFTAIHFIAPQIHGCYQSSPLIPQPGAWHLASI